MKRFALWVDDNGAYSRNADFQCFYNAETEAEAEEEAWRYVQCNCEEESEYDEDDGCEWECNCSAYAVEVAMDIEYFNGGDYFTEKEMLVDQIEEQNYKIFNAKRAVDLRLSKIETLKEEIQSIEANFSEMYNKLEALIQRSNEKSEEV